MSLDYTSRLGKPEPSGKRKNKIEGSSQTCWRHEEILGRSLHHPNPHYAVEEMCKTGFFGELGKTLL
jgi:hypothetical protein